MIDKYDLPKEELLTLLVEESKLAPQHQLPGEEIEGVNVTMQFLRDETGQVRYLPRRKVMGYDLDGVIFSMKKAIECTNQKLGTNLNIETMEAIDYELIYYATMDEDIQRKIIRESTPNRKMVEDLAEEHLNGAEIVLITARHVSYAKETIESLNRFGIYYDKIYFTEEKLPLIIGYNINQKCFISTFTSTFWCQLVLIIVINYLRGLELPHLAGAFFLASIQDSTVG